MKLHSVLGGAGGGVVGRGGFGVEGMGDICKQISLRF